MQHILEHIVNCSFEETLDSDWKMTNLTRFSNDKTLYFYQTEALQKAILALYFYFQGKDFGNIAQLSDLNTPNERKRDFLKRYQQHGLENKAIRQFLLKEETSYFDLLTEYYPFTNKGIEFYNFINRMSFWMATGSGKSLVLLKLMEVLLDLIKYDKIPERNFLFLTHRQDLINQIKVHLKEFNTYLGYEKGYEIVFRDLREFPEYNPNTSILFDGANLFKNRYINVFYYRSDLVNDVQKENIIDYKNYYNKGLWYVFLDEAHKGSKEDSKRQQLFSIFSQNGFLFNFSATFTDDIDLLTTVYNFNLAEFIKKGYGKHLYIFKQELKSFKESKGRRIIEEYTIEAKQKIVLMSLIMLAYVKKKYKAIREKIKQPDVFHNPLLLTLVNSVSTKDSDLLLFFKELEKIAQGQIKEGIYESAIRTLQKELTEKQAFEFETEQIRIQNEIGKITLKDVWKEVFNTAEKGGFEVRRNPKNHQELCFMIKSSAEPEPFALIKIGDTKAWVKNILVDYSIEENYNNVSVFENLEDSSINILMGSRAFYEGWDSNRPNIINFINIGTSKDAKKFILQSIGRGIRLKTVDNYRKRLKSLQLSGKLKATYHDLVEEVNSLETLFIFGTKRKAIQSVLEAINKEAPLKEYILEGIVPNVDDQTILLIPTYKEESTKNKGKRVKRFQIHEQDKALLTDILETMDAITVILTFNLSYADYKLLKEKYDNFQDNFRINSEKKIGHIDLLFRLIISYFRIIPETLATFKTLDEKIRHHKNIKVTLPEVRFKELQAVVNSVRQSKPIAEEKADLLLRFQKGEISTEKFMELSINLGKSKEEASFNAGLDKLIIKKIEPHYYTPILISDDAKIKWIKHIIDERSEVEFIKQLQEYLEKENNIFQSFDWWKFSKIDHTLDKDLRIPYIDLRHSEKRNFLPDFVFWCCKGTEYHIIFIDPKGVGRMEYQYKVDGYRALFEDEEGNAKRFSHQLAQSDVIITISVHLKLFTNDTHVIPNYESYKKYWIDSYGFEVLVS